jgi:hypothetical protein
MIKLNLNYDRYSTKTQAKSSYVSQSDPRCAFCICAKIAQLVEHSPEEGRVPSSNLGLGTRVGA